MPIENNLHTPDSLLSGSYLTSQNKKLHLLGMQICQYKPWYFE